MEKTAASVASSLLLELELLDPPPPPWAPPPLDALFVPLAVLVADDVDAAVAAALVETVSEGEAEDVAETGLAAAVAFEFVLNSLALAIDGIVWIAPICMIFLDLPYITYRRNSPNP